MCEENAIRGSGMLEQLPLSDELVSDPFILSIRQSEKLCKVRYFKRYCLCAGVAGFPVIKSGCMNRECPECATQIGKRRAGRVRERFKEGFKLKQAFRTVIYTVLTVPPSLRHRYVDKKVWRATIKKFWEYLQTHHGAWFGIECSHPHGENPRNFHPHANFLWIQYDGFKPFIPVEQLRAAWRRILDTEEEVNLYTQYFEKKEVLAHRTRYITRTFPGCATWIGSMRWYGKFPRGVVHEDHSHCPKCRERYLYVRSDWWEWKEYFYSAWALAIEKEGSA